MWTTSDALKPTRFLFVRLILLFLLTGAAHADLHKWVDESGQVNYGDCPPADCTSQTVDIPNPPSQEEVDRARERLERHQEIIQKLRTSRQDASPVITPAPQKLIPRELPCFDPLENILIGSAGELFTPIIPTILTNKQRRDLSQLFHKLDSHWRKGKASITICGQMPKHLVTVKKHEDDDTRIEVNTNTTKNRLSMKLEWFDSKEAIRGADFISLLAGDRLYFSTKPHFQNIAKPGNSVQILHLDKKSMLFLIKPRIRRGFPYPQLRYLVVSDNKGTLTELYYARNKLVERRNWLFAK